MSFKAICVLAFAVFASSSATSNGTASLSSAMPSISQHVMSSSVNPTNMSSTAMMSSSAAPIPPTSTPPATMVMFYYPEKSNVSCMTINGTVTFEVKYHTKNNNKTETAKIDLTKVDAVVTGQCVAKPRANGTGSITINWEKAYTMTLRFTFTTEDHWFLSEVMFKADAKKSKLFANSTKDSYSATKTFNASSNGAYHASNNHSYECHTDSHVKLGNMIVADFEDIQMQPFDMKKGEGFSHADLCPGDDSSTKPNSLVPIIVGCALAGLIVIVLIAYLIGRRKSSRGYQQV